MPKNYQLLKSITSIMIHQSEDHSEMKVTQRRMEILQAHEQNSEDL